MANKLSKLIIICLLMTGFLMLALQSNAQDKMAGPIIVCPANLEAHEFHVLPPDAFLKKRQARSVENDHIFEVDYIGFSPEAERAFQYAIEIWESILKSKVKIKVRATWEPLGSGVLGSAGASTLYRDFDNAPKKNAWYAVALAEKLAGTDLNSPTDFDIVASFNSDFSNWYLGTDGAASGQFDFVTVVLHELGHGLGFFSGDSFDSESGMGNWDLQGSGFPVIYTSFLENQNGQNILSLANNSTEVGDFLESNNAFMGSYLVKQNNGGSAKVFAPASYNEGSSISHWDENTYNSTTDALMTPSVAPSEVIHNPGLLTLSLFSDMGWFTTFINHENLQVAFSSESVKIEVDVVSDTSIVDTDFVLKYFYPGQDTLEVPLVKNEFNKYIASFNPDPIQTEFVYYLDGLTDAFNKSYRYPESGFIRVDLISLNLKSTPYGLTDGGDFEMVNADYNAWSELPDYQLWELGSPVNKFGNYSSQAWMTDLDEKLTKPKSDAENALISPLFNLTDTVADYTLSFDVLGEFSDLNYMQVFYSLDSGTHWKMLGNAFDQLGTNWYTINNDLSGFNQSTLNSNGNFEVRAASYPLFELAGNNVVFKFAHFTNSEGAAGDYQFDGVLIDNLQISKLDPSARFYSQDTTLQFPGNVVRFNYASSGAISYNWDFGDGTTSTQPNPNHIYQSGGLYTIKLDVVHANGASSFIRNDYIKVVENKGAKYLLADGGDFETNASDFFAVNIRGTGFERGKSIIVDKDGTSSGEFAWVTGLSSNEYENNSEAYLLTPEFDVSILGPYKLSFKAKYSFEDLWDGFIVEYSTDRGRNWKKLNERVTSGWYDSNSHPNSVFGASVPIFTGNTNGVFELKETDVSFLAGNEHVSFRFKFLTDPAEVDAGLALDDFQFIGPEPGEATLKFSTELKTGNLGCEGVEILFTNMSTGSIKGLDWFFGQEAIPSSASGMGPHVVKFPAAGDYQVLLNAIDINDAVLSKDSILQISAFHIPIITVTDNKDGSVLLSVTDGESYQWYLNDEPIPGATEQNLQINSIGSYGVLVTIASCSVYTNVGFLVAGVESQENLLSIYPNPADQYFELSGLDAISPIQQVELMDVSGRVWKIYQASEIQNRLRFVLPPSIPDGIYVLRFQSAQVEFVKRLIISH